MNLKKSILLISLCACSIISCNNASDKDSNNPPQISNEQENINSESVKKFYTVEKAYWDGIITFDELLSIAYYYNGKVNYSNYEVKKSTDFSLGETIMQEIREDYASYMQSKGYGLFANQVLIKKSYGNYRNYTALWIEDCLYDYDKENIERYSINDVIFANYTHNQILIYKYKEAEN